LACSGVVLKQYGHTLDLIEMALSMHHMPLPPALVKKVGVIELRIGVHTGEVYAGVVGRKMPRYHLFGETVTLAQKFESQGVPKQVVVSGVTIQELQKCGRKTERRLLMQQLPDRLKVDMQDVILSALPETYTERWLITSRLVELESRKGVTYLVPAVFLLDEPGNLNTPWPNGPFTLIAERSRERIEPPSPSSSRKKRKQRPRASTIKVHKGSIGGIPKGP
jgi:hypothetical protein